MTFIVRFKRFCASLFSSPAPLFTNSLPLGWCRCAIPAIIISILLFLLLIFLLLNLFLLLCATRDAFYWIGCCTYWKRRCHIDCPRSLTLCLGRKYFINYIFVVATFAMVWLRILCSFFFRSSVVRSLFDVFFSFQRNRLKVVVIDIVAVLCRTWSQKWVLVSSKIKAWHTNSITLSVERFRKTDNNHQITGKCVRFS